MNSRMMLGLAVSAFCGAAFAGPLPTACWDGDFNVAEKAGIKLNANDNTVAPDGAYVTLTGDTANGVTFDWNGDKTACTIVFKCSGLQRPATDYATLITTRVKNVAGDCNNRPGILLDAQGLAYGVWQDAAWETETYKGGPLADEAGSRRFAFRYVPKVPQGKTVQRGVTFFEGVEGAWRSIYAVEGLVAGADFPQACTIGGFNGDSSLYQSCAGMRIEAVAIFLDALTDADLAMFHFDSDVYVPQPVALWDGDFGETEKGGISLDLNGHALAQDGRSIVVGDGANGGVLLDLPAGTPLATVLMKCSDVTLPASGYAAVGLFSVPSMMNRVGEIVDANGLGSGVWGGAPWETATYNGPLSRAGGERWIALRYEPLLSQATSRGVHGFDFRGGVWRENYASSGLQSGADQTAGISRIALGGPDGAVDGIANLGMRIESIAVFFDEVGTERLETYFFASDVCTNRATAATGDWSALAWDDPWRSGGRSMITLETDTDTSSSVAFDADVQMGTLAIVGAGDVAFTAAEGRRVLIGAIDARGATGTVSFGFATGEATVKANGAIRLDAAGEGELMLDAESVVELGAGWRGPIVGGGTVNAAGGVWNADNIAGFTGLLKVAGGTVALTNGTPVACGLALESGTLVLPVGQEDGLDVPAGATLKLCFADDSYVNGFTAEGVTLAPGENVVFVLPDGTEVEGEGATLPRPTNVWTASGAGAWSTAEKWSLGHVPTTGENIAFRPAGGAATVTLDADVARVGQVQVDGDVTLKEGALRAVAVTVAAGSSLTVDVPEGTTAEISGGVSGGGTLVKRGAGCCAVSPDEAGVVLAMETVNLEAGALTFAGGCVDGAFAVASGATLDATGTLVSSNALAFTAAADATVFTNAVAALEIAGPLTVGGAGKLTFACPIVCEGTFTVNGAVELTRDCSFAGALKGGVDACLEVTRGMSEFTGSKEDFRGDAVVTGEGVMSTTDGSFGRRTLSGDGVFRCRGALPGSLAQTSLQDAELWRGTCWLYQIDDEVADLNPKKYGNLSSVVRLTGVTGYLNRNDSCDVPVELVNDAGVKAFTLNNGYSADVDAFTFAKVFGSGTLEDVNTATQIIRILDGSGLTGDINLQAKRVVFGVSTNAVPARGGILIVEAGHTNNIGVANTWRVPGDTIIRGTVNATEYGNLWMFVSTTVIEETGVLHLHLDNDMQEEASYDCSRITGTGTVRFTGVSRYLQETVDKLPAATLRIQNDTENYAVIAIYGTADAPALTTIGTLSGSGDFCTAYHGGADSRSLRVVQADDSEWSGNFDGKTVSTIYDRFHTLYVDGAEGAAHRTLTLSGDNSRCLNNLVVCSNGSARVTGTWRGDVTVSGAFGGDGTILDGTLTFEEGAVFDVRGGVLHAPAFAATGDRLVLMADELPRRATKIMELPSAEGATTLPRAVLRVNGRDVGGFTLTRHGGGLYLAPEPTLILVR